MDEGKLLKWLVERPSETEFIEFKIDNSNAEILGQNISAISNAACLHDVEYGYIVFGVENETHSIVGTHFNPKQAKVGAEDLELWLNKLLDPSINFEIHEFMYFDKMIIIFKVPACMHRPTRFKGASFLRIGANTRNLQDFPEKESQIWNKTRNRGFELMDSLSSLQEDEVLSLLDYSRYFRTTGQKLPSTPKGIIAALEEEKFVKRNDGGEYSITNLGAILFAIDLSKFPNLKGKAPRVITYKGSDKTSGANIKERGGKFGYAVGFESLIDYINNQLPSSEVLKQALRIERKVYPEIAIRELVANALIHQDLTERGTGPTVEIFDDRIEISNPGKPLISADRFLDHKPQSRNENLAAFMRRIGYCEERGSGIDKVLSAIEVFQLPPPKFEDAEKYLRVSVFSSKDVRDMTKEERTRACYQHAALRYVSNEAMTNASLRERFNLSNSKTDTVFVSNIIAEAIKAGSIKLLGSDPKARRSAKYGPYWA